MMRYFHKLTDDRKMYRKSMYIIGLCSSEDKFMPLQNYRGPLPLTCYHEVANLFVNDATSGVKHWPLRLHAGNCAVGVKQE